MWRRHFLSVVGTQLRAARSTHVAAQALEKQKATHAKQKPEEGGGAEDEDEEEEEEPRPTLADTDVSRFRDLAAYQRFLNARRVYMQRQVTAA